MQSYIYKVLAVVVATLVLPACTKLFFYPYKTLVGTPTDLGYRYVDVWLTTEDNTSLHAWLIPPEEESRGLVLFLHGNAENISTHVRSVLWLVVQGYTVMALDYRGYGLSAGKPDLPEVFDDINTAFSWLQEYRLEQATPVPLYLFGQSLGASLSIKYLELFPNARAQVAGVVSEAAFARYGDIARHVAAGFWVTWPFQYPLQWALPDDYDTIDAIGELPSLPILLIHSRQDEIIPFENVLQLAEQAGEAHEMLVTEGLHIHGVRDPLTRSSILDFLSRHAH